MEGNNQAYEFEHGKRFHVLVLRPRLNDEWTKIEDHAKRMLAEVEQLSPPRLLLDLGQLEHCGSVVVALMVRVWKKLQERRGVMVACCASDLVEEVLATARLTDLWEICETREEAEKVLRSLRAGRGEPGHYNPARPACRLGAALLALIGLLGVAGLVLLILNRATIETHPVGLVAIGFVAAVFLALAIGVAAGSRDWVLFAKFWICVALVSYMVMLGLLFVQHRNLLPDLSIGERLIAMVVLIAALLIVWLVWRSLDRAQRAIDEAHAGSAARKPVP